MTNDCLECAHITGCGWCPKMDTCLATPGRPLWEKRDYCHSCRHELTRRIGKATLPVACVRCTVYGDDKPTRWEPTTMEAT